MIELCIFDMGGVIIRDFSIGPELLPYLGYPGLKGFQDLGTEYYSLIEKHSIGEITEDELKTEEDKLQKLTDKYVAEINKIYDAKEKDILEG